MSCGTSLKIKELRCLVMSMCYKLELYFYSAKQISNQKGNCGSYEEQDKHLDQEKHQDQEKH